MSTTCPSRRSSRPWTAARTSCCCGTGPGTPWTSPEFVRLRELIAEARTLQEDKAHPHGPEPGPDQPLGAVRGPRHGHAEAERSGARPSARWRTWTRSRRPPCPEALQATLRPYQYEGFRWLSFLWERSLGGDPRGRHGAGQDRADQSAAAMLRAVARDPRLPPFLVIAPPPWWPTGRPSSRASRRRCGPPVLTSARTRCGQRPRGTRTWC
ncbi:hypothetical protein QJS66_08960 [Kocuria rhizophila]|nr:hypothetical protein QJS66_08960 [Kocuria rhizophila]